MTDQDQRPERNDEQVEDLEVRSDEAREVAGGREVSGLDSESEVVEQKR